MKRFDYQRQRMYDWEKAHVMPLAHTKRTMPECRVVTALCSSLYATEPPYLPARPRTRVRGNCHGDGRINLPEWTRRDYYIIHEAAHHVVNHVIRHWLGHGAVFMRVVIDLLATVAGVNLSHLEYTAHAEGLRVADRDLLTQVPMDEAQELTGMWFRQADIDPRSGKPRRKTRLSRGSAHSGAEMQYDDFRLLLKDEYVLLDESLLPPAHLQ